MRTLLGFALIITAGLIILATPANADDTIYDIQLGVYEVGTPVSVEGVVVTGVGRYGFVCQEPDPHPDWEWQYSGIWVYTSTIPTVRRGDLVDITAEYQEYYELSELDVFNAGGTVTKVGTATEPAPVELLMTDVNNVGAFSEAYESVIIRVDLVDDTLYPRDIDGNSDWWLRPDPDAIDDLSLKMDSFSGLPYADFVYDIPDTVGVILSFAQGMLTYNFNEYKLAPRNCDEDLGMACKPRLRGAYATSSTGVNCQFGVALNQESAETVANYQLTSGLSIYTATLDPEDSKRVMLTTDDLGNGEEEEIIVSNIISDQGAQMDEPESRPFRTGYTPIETIQFVSNPGTTDISPLFNEVVTVRGRVTGLDGNNYYFLQDSDGGMWDGIYIYVAKQSPLSVGRNVIVAGRINEYNGMTEISYSSGVDYYVDLGYNTSVDTNPVTATDVPYRGAERTAEPWEGCLVRMESARLDSLEGLVGPYFDEWLLFQDGYADTSMMDMAEINGTKGYDACIGDEINLTGLLGPYFDTYSIWPRTGRGIDIEVIYDNPACEPTGAQEVPPAARGASLRSDPNPFNPRTTIRFRLDVGEPIHLDILDPSGRVVRTLIADADGKAGFHQIVWDGRDDAGHPVGTGTYFARLQTTDGYAARKMILLK